MTGVSTDSPPDSTHHQSGPQTALDCMRCRCPNDTRARFCMACGLPLVPIVIAGAAQAAQISHTIVMAAPVPTAAPVVVVGPQNAGPGLLVRGLYFIFIGCWLGAMCTTLAWMLNATVIGLPSGLMIINRLPQIMTLKPAGSGMTVRVPGGMVAMRQGSAAQYGFLVRALYFVLVGWWFSALWLLTAWSLLGITFSVALPLAFWMFNRVGAVTTLGRL